MNGSKFATDEKTSAGYLDVAANANGEEKGLLTYQALQRVDTERPRVVEIGPGGGSAVEYLASRLATDSRSGTVDLTLVEVPGVQSATLADAMAEYRKVGGPVELVAGFAQDLGSLLAEPVDVISASALMHEVYSYGGGYGGLHDVVRALPTVLRPGGLFAYRDVYAVDAESLHVRSRQTYDGRPWTQFLRMFLPLYLSEGTHPYHGAHDEVLIRQDSRITPLQRINPDRTVIVDAPVGVCREAQRHFITMRDYVWRSGVLGFSPILEGELAAHWHSAREGHKQVHYRLTDSRLSESQRAMMLALSETFADHLTVDGDIFDVCSDIALSRFLTLAEAGDDQCRPVWDEWSVREGRETYAYLTLDALLSAFAVSSTEACGNEPTILVPVHVSDVARRNRNYYNRYLRRTLANPLRDAKQLVLFSNIRLADTDRLQSAMDAMQRWCSRSTLARVYAAASTAG